MRAFQIRFFPGAPGIRDRDGYRHAGAIPGKKPRMSVCNNQKRQKLDHERCEADCPRPVVRPCSSTRAGRLPTPFSARRPAS